MTTETMGIQQQKMAKAYTLLSREDKPERIDENTYRIISQNGNWYYTIRKDGRKWTCDCPDHNKRQADCKHIYAVKFWKKFSGMVNIEKVEDCKPLNFQNCYKCGSYDVVKRGTRKTKKGKKQRFWCKDCGTSFILKDEFSGIIYETDVVCKAMDLYFSGLSTRKVADHLNQFYKLKITHVTIYYWVTKFSKAINEYVKEFHPELSGVWNVDETMIKVKHGGVKMQEGGQYVWLWNCMDSSTRFIIANSVSTKRGIKDARRLFKEAKNVGGRPDVIITDGLHSYHKAFNREFWTRDRKTRLIQNVGIAGRPNNNKIERYHGEIKDRTKTQRGHENKDTSEIVLNGIKDYHNFIRPHSALGGKTPAEVAGINLNLGEKKWENLLKQSLKIEDEDQKVWVKKITENRSLDQYF